MAFDATAGRILATDEDGRVLLDTDEKLFHTVDELEEGTVSFSARSHSYPSSYVNETNDTLIDTCHADCTHVIGSVKFTGTGNFGVAFDRWTTYMGGDLVWIMAAPGLTAAAAGLVGPSPHLVVLYSFFVDAGDVYLRQRVRLPTMEFLAPGSTVTIAAHDITYKLECGLFT